MPLPFAAVRYIQRSKGHSALKRLAYICRTQARSSRTGQSFDFRHREAPVTSFALLPHGAPADLQVPEVLWNAVEQANERADAAWGIDLLLLLPATGELSDDLAVALVRRFISQVIVEPHELGATVAVHRPHMRLDGEDLHLEAGEREPDDRFAQLMTRGDFNVHAHVLLTPRQVKPDGLARKRYTALDVQHGKSTAGLNWGRLWGRFQDAFYFEQGLDLRVRPNPPVPLLPKPLGSVRTDRKSLIRRNANVKGRELVVSPERDDINKDLLSSITGALACFEGPLTPAQLTSFFERYFSYEHARELTEAAIGLGDVVQLRQPDGSTSPWLASVETVVTELACLGRILILARRRLGAVQPPAFGSGFPDHTTRILQGVAISGSLAVIEVGGSPRTLLEDLAWLAQQQSLAPVTILHAGGGLVPKAIKRSLRSLRRTPASRAMLILNDPDALTLTEIDLLLQATVAGNNKLVVLRHQRTVWPRHQLLDIMEDHVAPLHWSSSGTQPSFGGRSSTTAFLTQLTVAGRLEFVAAKELQAGELLQGLQHSVLLPGLVIPDPVLRAECLLIAAAAHIPVPITCTVEENPAPSILLPVTAETVRALATMLQASSRKQILLKVSSSLASSPAELTEAMYRSRLPTAATALLYDGISARGPVYTSPPYFAVTPQGDIRSEAKAIGEAVTHWTFAPVALEWPRYTRARKREHRELQDALASWLGRISAEPGLPKPPGAATSRSDRLAQDPGRPIPHEVCSLPGGDRPGKATEAGHVELVLPAPADLVPAVDLYDSDDDFSAEAVADSILSAAEVTEEDCSAARDGPDAGEEDALDPDADELDGIEPTDYEDDLSDDGFDTD